MLVKDSFFIGGEWAAPSGSGVIDVINPVTEEPMGRVPDGTTADIDRAITAARNAFDHGDWATAAPSERAKVLGHAHGILMARMDEIAELITNEMGSPISFSKMGQVFAPLMMLDYYANLASSYPFEEVRQGVMTKVLVRREAVGVVGAIVPWNVPMFTTMEKLAPALLAGCTIVLKPAPETPLDAYVLAEAFQQAGLPDGVLNIVPAGREAGEHLVTHPLVDKISFTGSTAAGKRIAELCGAQLKRCSLELGGKSAAIILDDADLGTVVPQLLPNIVMNTGQACVAQTRVLASRQKYADVVDALASAMKQLTIGDPMDEHTQIGPLVAERQRQRVEGYIAAGLDEGAEVVAGGGRPSGIDKGWYVEPTVFANVDNKMKIAQEEIFGPVASVIAYDDVDDAIRIANDSEYGLSGSVWTADPQRGIDVARRVRTGTYTVNHGILIDFGAPFGGFKQSGIGRELGPEGLSGFQELKSIVLEPGYDPNA